MRSATARAVAFSLGLALTLVGSMLGAQTHPFAGVTMVRDSGGTLLVADLCAPGLSVRATRYAERYATPQTWATRAGVDAAINGDFYVFPSASAVSGRARGAGEDWPPGTQNDNPEVRSYWQFGPHAAALIDPSTIEPPPPSVITDIVGAHNVIIRGGRSLAPDFDGDGVLATGHARTAIGLSTDGRTLYLFATRTLMTGTELADALLRYAARAGAPDIGIATNQDGGGSSQMYVRGYGQVVDSGRPVANHLGIVATGVGAAPMCPRAECSDGFVNAPEDPLRCVARTDVRVFLADFDGDGRDDLATLSANAGGPWTDAVAIERSTGSGFASSRWSADTPRRMRAGGEGRFRTVLGDFNRDGRADLATVSPNAGGDWASSVSLELSSATGFRSERWSTPTPMHMRNGDFARDYRVLVGDVDGDGASDLITLSPNAGGGWADWASVDRAMGAGFASQAWPVATATHMRNGGAADYRVLVGDFNGDGKSDVATISPDAGGGWADWVAMELSTGAGFTSTVWSAATPTHMRNGDSASKYDVLAGDFDGDGRTDLATISPNAGGGWADWVAMELSTGTGFRSTTWATPTPTHMRNGDGARDYRVLVGDFDADGKSDLATISPNALGGWADWASIDRSTGAGFAQDSRAALTPGHMRNGGAAEYRVLVGDVNGDRRSDLVTVSPNAGGGWADWAAVELDTGGGFASASWSAQTPSRLRAVSVVAVDRARDDASGLRLSRRTDAGASDAARPIDATARDDVATDATREVFGGDATADASDAAMDGDVTRAHGGEVKGDCGCGVAMRTTRAIGPWIMALAALGLHRRGRRGHCAKR